MLEWLAIVGVSRGVARDEKSIANINKVEKSKISKRMNLMNKMILKTIVKY